MSGTYRSNNGIRQAIQVNKLQNYIYNHADNTKTEIGTDPIPTNIFPNQGAINNFTEKPYNDYTFYNGTPDIYNTDKLTRIPSTVINYPENAILPDLINIGLNQKVKSARTIGTSSY